MLAGVATAWAADLVPGRRTWRTAPSTASWYERAGNGLTLACGVLAAAPDIDILFLSHFNGHRTITHSIGAVFFVGLFAAAMAAKSRRPIARVALMCAAAYGTHLLLDWLGADNFPPRGLQALWPFTREWYISDLDVFRQTARRHIASGPIMRQNALAIVQEIAVLLPIAVGLWLVRVKALARLASEMAGRDHAAQ